MLTRRMSAIAARIARDAAVPFHSDWSNVAGRRKMTHTSSIGCEGAIVGLGDRLLGCHDGKEENSCLVEPEEGARVKFG